MPTCTQGFGYIIGIWAHRRDCTASSASSLGQGVAQVRSGLQFGPASSGVVVDRLSEYYLRTRILTLIATCNGQAMRQSSLESGRPRPHLNLGIRSDGAPHTSTGCLSTLTTSHRARCSVSVLPRCGWNSDYRRCTVSTLISLARYLSRPSLCAIAIPRLALAGRSGDSRLCSYRL